MTTERQRRNWTLPREGASLLDKDLRTLDHSTEAAKINPEFDQYAAGYSRLLQDPIRNRFVNNSDFFHRRKWILIRDFLAQHKATPSRLSWLDVGCGQGELLKIAGGEFAQAVGCDPSTKMIETSTSAQIQQQDSPTELPFADKSFDFVTAVCVYHHVHGDERILLTNSIHRILKPGGVFCLIEHNPWNPVTQLIVKRCPVDSGAELLSPSRAVRLISSAGLELIETAYFLYFPERVFKGMARIEHFLRRWPMGGQFATFSRKRAREQSQKV
jgi:SAM-dependent methyltransferase